MKIIRCNYVFISKKVNINFLKISVISIILNTRNLRLIGLYIVYVYWEFIMIQLLLFSNIFKICKNFYIKK